MFEIQLRQNQTCEMSRSFGKLVETMNVDNHVCL